MNVGLVTGDGGMKERSMVKVAVIGGSGVLGLELFAGLQDRRVKTEYGPVTVAGGEGLAFLQRHGDPPLPPHRINHRANLKALAELGCKTVLALNSTGSLKPNLRPGSLVVPDDYFNPWVIPTFFDDRLEFTTPGLSQRVRQAILAAAAAAEIEIVAGGTYIQTTGPRFETRAEIRVLSGWGELVGMTMAAEATLAKELGLEYAALCLVDNYANGVCEQTVSFAEIEKAQRQNSFRLARLLPAVLERLRPAAAGKDE
jgi:5'-methylthioadenosine phosphorylase